MTHTTPTILFSIFSVCNEMPISVSVLAHSVHSRNFTALTVLYAPIGISLSWCLVRTRCVPHLPYRAQSKTETGLYKSYIARHGLIAFMSDINMFKRILPCLYNKISFMSTHSLQNFQYLKTNNLHRKCCMLLVRRNYHN